MHPYMASQLNQWRESELRCRAETYRQLLEGRCRPAAVGPRPAILQQTRAALASDIKRLAAWLDRRPPVVAPAADRSA